MSAFTNRYAGQCQACGHNVPAMTGKCERRGEGRRARWTVWCLDCFDRSERVPDKPAHVPDRFDLAYEDRCAEICGC